MTTATGGDQLRRGRAHRRRERDRRGALGVRRRRPSSATHPRTGYIQALDGFTDGAAELAARDLDVLTASGVEDLTAVRATRLDTDLSLYVVDGDVARGDGEGALRLRRDTADGEHPAAQPRRAAAATAHAGRLGGLRVRRRQRRRRRAREGRRRDRPPARWPAGRSSWPWRCWWCPAGGVPAGRDHADLASSGAEGVDVAGPIVWVLAARRGRRRAHRRDPAGRHRLAHGCGHHDRHPARQPGSSCPVGEDRINTAYPDQGPTSSPRWSTSWSASPRLPRRRRLRGVRGAARRGGPGDAHVARRRSRATGSSSARARTPSTPDEALAYVRHRLSFVDQDFSRSANQQRLMAAALEAYQSRAEMPGSSRRPR